MMWILASHNLFYLDETKVVIFLQILVIRKIKNLLFLSSANRLMLESRYKDATKTTLIKVFARGNPSQVFQKHPHGIIKKESYQLTALPITVITMRANKLTAVWNQEILKNSNFSGKAQRERNTMVMAAGAFLVHSFQAVKNQKRLLDLVISTSASKATKKE